jgi:site-specific DNA-methyltransferase (adenine-specific)
MTPYYEDDLVTLYHGDCREVDAWLSADVLVTDPPYGIEWKARYGRAQHGTKDQKFANRVIAADTDSTARDDVLAMWAGTDSDLLAARALAKRPAIVFGSWRVTRPDHVHAMLIWHKEGAYSGPLVAPFFTNHEEVYVIGKAEWRKSAPPLRSVITSTEHRSQATRDIGHPTPKPVALMEALIDRCPPGVIADPFVGSGSTLLAARQLGRKVIGVEVEERYCELAASRLAQDSLFVGGF